MTLLVGLLFLTSIALGQSSKALIYDLIYLRTDKEVYYADESIQIEASWTLSYVETDHPFFQIRIFDSINRLIWNSSEFKEEGLFDKNWTIQIANLNFNFTDYSNMVSIRAYIINAPSGGNPTSCILETVTITILKRTLCCDLFNFSEKVVLGDNLSLQAHFYREETNHSLLGEEIVVSLISNNVKMYEKNFTLNSQGRIFFNISSVNDMLLGINDLILNLSNSFIYNNSIFHFQIIVEKNPVQVDILKYKEKIGWPEDVELELFFYYYDESIIPLINQTIEIVIYDNYTANYRIYARTNEFGLLKINISTSSYGFDCLKTKFYIDLIFNGSEFLKEKSLVLKFEILTAKLPNYPSFITFLIIIVVCILSFIAILNHLYQYKKKRPKYKNVNEIAFRF
ncbi:MAG: hypothetical protein EU549_04935 [Promethearchaeota archaeon]|nr:MAG: hypothetical protein EU549_04935 [Candidatus Lokiarchaeota archaeon]